MGLARRSFLRDSVLSLSSFGFISPAWFAESERPTSVAPPTTTETAAIRAQIEANNRAVDHAIVTMDFAALERLWAPVMEVNSPGDNNTHARASIYRHARGPAEIYEL